MQKREQPPYFVANLVKTVGSFKSLRPVPRDLCSLLFWSLNNIGINKVHRPSLIVEPVYVSTCQGFSMQSGGSVDRISTFLLPF